jgi:uncharacterized protein (DUF1697 family)
MRYVAFLRAINVGGHTVKMVDLAEIFNSFGVTNVKTFIQSGNVIFESNAKEAELTKKIEQGLQSKLDYGVSTFLRTETELSSIIKANPFGNDDSDETITIFITFFALPPTAEQKTALENLKIETEKYHLNGRELYTRFRRDSKIQDPFSNSKMEKLFKQAATTRNITTLKKIESMLA